jgi:hypothetical protein
MFNLSDYITDSDTCSCSTEESFTPETVYRSLSRRYYDTSDSDSCCGGAPNLNDEASDLNSIDDETDLDDDDDGGGSDPPDPPIVDPPPVRNLPPTYGESTINIVPPNQQGTYTSDQPIFPPFYNVNSPLMNNLLIESVTVTNKIDGTPAHPLQQDFFENQVFGMDVTKWGGVPQPNDNLLQVDVKFNFPIDFNSIYIQAPYTWRYVFGDTIVNATGGDPALLPPIGPYLAAAQIQRVRLRNFYLINANGNVHYDHYLNSGLSQTLPFDPPGLKNYDRPIGVDGNLPKHNVYQIGRIAILIQPQPNGTTVFRAGEYSRQGYGETHKFRFDIVPSETTWTNTWNFTARDPSPLPP